MKHIFITFPSFAYQFITRSKSTKKILGRRGLNFSNSLADFEEVIFFMQYITYNSRCNNMFKVNMEMDIYQSCQKQSLEVLCKKGVLKLSQNSQKNTCAGVQRYQKDTAAQVFSCEFCEIFQFNLLWNTSGRLLNMQQAAR